MFITVPGSQSIDKKFRNFIGPLGHFSRIFRPVLALNQDAQR